MCATSEQYEKICKGEFEKVHRTLDRMDVSIRGNGKIGLTGRIDRLERAEARRNQMYWLMMGALIVTGLSLVIRVGFTIWEIIRANHN